MPNQIIFAAEVIYCYLGLLCWIGVLIAVQAVIAGKIRERRAHRAEWDSTGDEVLAFADGLARVRGGTGWLGATGEFTPVWPPRVTRTVVPVAPAPAWAAGYQPGPITREFARIVGTEFPTWTQAELDLEAVS